MPPRHLRLALSGALFAFGLVSIVDAAAPVAGEKWRMTSSSSMGMPGQSMEMCLPKRASANQAPPPPQQKSCTVSNVQHSGSKQTMHMRCDTNGQVMEGDMEQESLGPDHYRTTMHMNMAAMGKVDMVSEYQKLDGVCDASVTAAMPTGARPGAASAGASGETPPWAKPGSMDAAKAEARQRAEAEAAQAPKEESKDKVKSKLKGLIGF
jgi:hypothetical protein